MNADTSPVQGPLGLIVGRPTEDMHYTGDNSIDIIMPDGSLCPASKHGIPDMDAGMEEVVSTTHAAVTEVDGVLYMCGGKEYRQGKSRSHPTGNSFSD